jgi:hypothetical protein
LFYEEFIKSNLKETKRLIQICLNSEFYARQKMDLITRALLHDDDKSQIDLKYICLGYVKSDEAELSSDELSKDPLHNYKSREEYFRFASKQRQIISNSLNESNIVILAQFSFLFDLLNSNYQNDIKKFVLVDAEKMDFDEEAKAFDQSSFILYSCARMHAIIEKFESLVSQGINYFRFFVWSQYVLFYCIF